VQIGDILLLQDLRHDHVRSRANFEYTLVREGKVEKKSTSVRLYAYHELCQLLEAVGFAECEEYGSLSQELFKLGSRWLYLVATKNCYYS
jgi:hypothetical protein